MILLIQNPKFDIATFITIFKFHYDSINSDVSPPAKARITHLNSIMILLIRHAGNPVPGTKRI